MKKLLVLILSSIILVTGCASNIDNKDEIITQESKIGTSDDYFIEGNQIEESLKDIEFFEMTDNDNKNLNDAIEIYYYADSTLSDSDVNYLIEKKPNGEYHAVFLFLKPKDSLPEDFKFNLTEAIVGALSVNGLSVEYNAVQVVLYDEDGTIYKSEVFKNQ